MATIHKKISGHCLIRSMFLALAVFVVSACDGDFKAQTSLPAAIFSGAESIKQLGDNSFELAWKEPVIKAGRLRYRIYLKQLDTLPEGGVAIAGAGTRTVTFHELQGDSLPAAGGQLIAEVEGNTLSYQVTQALSTDVSFAFQVKALNEEGIVDENKVVLVLHKQEKVVYTGCKSYESTKDSITLTFEFPAKASKVNIYRGGQIVHSSVSQSEVTYRDTGLTPATSYDYICEAVVGESRWIGSNVLTALTQNPLSGYVGCLEGRPLGANDIEISFPMPSEADKITIYRDGNPIYSRSTSSKSATTLAVLGNVNKDSVKIVDRNLQEAVEYTYQCAASIGSMEVIGENELVISTLSSNPPTFTGVREVTALSPRSVRITWGVSSGVQSTKFQVFATPGSTIDWTQPAKIVDAGVLQADITGLGDELSYSFGVRACSRQDVCDSNKTIKTLTLADGGAPLTKGATGSEKVNREFNIIAPWQATDGAITMRRVYRMTGASPSTNFASFIDYGTNGLEFPVTNPLAPPTKLNIGALEENQTYHFIVRDFDKSGNSNLSMATVTVAVGDITPPVWLDGIAALQTPSDVSLQESALVARFTGIITETASALFGASHYQVYVLEIGTALDASKSACNLTTPTVELDANNYTAGANHTYVISGLKARTWYSVCLKARDKSGNISETTAHRTALVKDRTPPLFSGIQAISIVNKKIRFLWNPSSSSDLYSYHIKFWTNNVTPVPIELPAIVGFSPSLYYYDLDPTAYPQLANGGQVYAIVNACDDFGQKVSGEQNCTTYGLNDFRFLPNLPDLSPPANFGGIVRAERGSSEGQIYVQWSTPTDRSDYAGFAIYNVVNSTISEFPLEKCLCSGNNCQTDNRTSCTINLAPGRGYNLTVRAFDRSDNLTSFVADQVFPIVYAPDTTAPTWTGNDSFITGSFSQLHTRNDVTFNLATDNQYDKSPAAIAYKIYRKSFAGKVCSSKSIGDIPISGAAHDTHVPASTATTTTTYSDKDLASTTTYLYRIVAIDQQTIPIADNERNRKEDTGFACVETGDTVKPVFVGGTGCPEETTAGGCPVLNRTNPDDKVWHLSWDMNDPNSGGTARSNMFVQVWKTTSTSKKAPDVGASLEKLVANYQIEYNGDGALRFPADPSEKDSGPANQNTWVHYVVVIGDKDNGIVANKTWASVSVYSENKIEVTQVTRSQGTAAGGKLVAIHGFGFTSTSEVYFDFVDPTTRCLNVRLVKIADYADTSNPIKKLVCTTPAWTLPSGADYESVNVIIKTNDREVSSPNSVKYTFYNYGTGTGYDYVCDQTYAANSLNAGGTGTSGDPYLMCTVNHLKQISSSKSYHLRDNIDLNGVTWTPLATVSQMKLNGNDYFISSMKTVVAADATSREPWYSFISRMDAGVTVSNLYFVDFVLDASNQLTNVAAGSVTFGRYGALTSYASGDASSVVTFENVRVSGNITNNAKPVNAGLIAGYSRFVRYKNVSAYGDIAAGDPARSVTGQAGGITGIADRGPTFYENVVYVGKIDANLSAGGLTSVVSNAMLTDVRVNAEITCLYYCGGLVGTIAGPFGGSTDYETSITRASSSGKLIVHSNGYYHGGIAGIVNSRSRFEDVTSDMATNVYMWSGGIIGGVALMNTTDPADRTLTLNKVRYTGELTTAGSGGPGHHMALGGLIGRVHPQTSLTTLNITNSSFTGKMNVTRIASGGIIGAIDESGRTLDLTLDSVAVNGPITSTAPEVGGLIGRIAISGTNTDWTHITIKNSYAGGTFTGDSVVGGLIGTVQAKDPYTIENSYSDAKIVAANHLGGLVGKNLKGDNTVTVVGRFNNTYSRATFEFNGIPSLLTKGGLIAYDEGQTTNLVSTFYNTDRAGSNILYACGNKTSTTSFGRTNTQFANSVNFTGWNSALWDWDDGYPVLTVIRTMLAP